MRDSRSRLKLFWRQLPFFLWLVVLWMLLWGQLTMLALVTGVLVAIFVTTWFRLPAAQMSGRVNLWYGLVFGVTFVVELVHGALSVSWEVLRPGPTRAAIIRVPLRVDDDLIMTHVAVASSLIPGSTVIEADRERRVLYLHAIGMKDLAAVDAQRRRVQHWEERAVAAVGTRAQLRALREGAGPVADRVDAGGAE
ncbi:Na+/H+ antiporter subunit E [Microbacterium sp. Marseille-Q6965]|uniref:Na+/H+ antiporter subunit E n=1 Tax=Microbacterium sp. Marseille-Q6965 TaxID=2965072 RepID=UPI0021B77D51|nr:Na+/H+ antiporter subunit E [Microbacterium sp. Marseille-Q6965]